MINTYNLFILTLFHYKSTHLRIIILIKVNNIINYIHLLNNFHFNFNFIIITIIIFPILIPFLFSIHRFIFQFQFIIIFIPFHGICPLFHINFPFNFNISTIHPSFPKEITNKQHNNHNSNI